MSKQQADRRRLSDFFHRRDGGDTRRPQARRWWRRRGTSAQELLTAAPEAIGPAAFNKPGAAAGPRRGRRQVDALREQRARGNSIRDWLQQRLMAAEKRAKARREAASRLKVSRGTDRVPEHLRDVERPQTWLVRHETTVHPVTGRWVKGLPYTNPVRRDRLAKSGRLRAELRADLGEQR